MERIYLDALQARLASDELTLVVDEGLEQAKSKGQLDTDLEALRKSYRPFRKASFSILLDRRGYVQAGANQANSSH